jgi:hypothetical protein
MTKDEQHANFSEYCLLHCSIYAATLCLLHALRLDAVPPQSVLKLGQAHAFLETETKPGHELFKAPVASPNFAATLSATRPLTGTLQLSRAALETEAEKSFVAYSHDRKVAAWTQVGGEGVWNQFSWQQKRAVIRSQVISHKGII